MEPTATVLSTAMPRLRAGVMPPEGSVALLTTTTSKGWGGVKESKAACRAVSTVKDPLVWLSSEMMIRMVGWGERLAAAKLCRGRQYRQVIKIQKLLISPPSGITPWIKRARRKP